MQDYWHVRIFIIICRHLNSTNLTPCVMHGMGNKHAAAVVSALLLLIFYACGGEWKKYILLDSGINLWIVIDSLFF